jgi:hypothetical protein
MRMTLRATPTPIPAFAPVERPELDCDIVAGEELDGDASTMPLLLDEMPCMLLAELEPDMLDMLLVGSVQD